MLNCSRFLRITSPTVAFTKVYSFSPTFWKLLKTAYFPSPLYFLSFSPFFSLSLFGFNFGLDTDSATCVVNVYVTYTYFTYAFIYISFYPPFCDCTSSW